MASGVSIYKIQADMIEILSATLSNVLLEHTRTTQAGTTIKEPGILAGPLPSGVRIDVDTHGVSCRITDPTDYPTTQFAGGSQQEGRVYDVILDLWLPSDLGIFDQEAVLHSLEPAGMGVKRDLLKHVPGLGLARDPVHRHRTETFKERFILSFEDGHFYTR